MVVASRSWRGEELQLARTRLCWRGRSPAAPIVVSARPDDSIIKILHRLKSEICQLVNAATCGKCNAML